jgi:hypothetical protein
MNFENKSVVSAVVVVVLTLLAEIPSVNHWLQGAMLAHGNLVVLVEGIIALILVMFAGSQSRRMAVK